MQTTTTADRQTRQRDRQLNGQLNSHPAEPKPSCDLCGSRHKHKLSPAPPPIGSSCPGHSLGNCSSSAGSTKGRAYGQNWNSIMQQAATKRNSIRTQSSGNFLLHGHFLIIISYVSFAAAPSPATVAASNGKSICALHKNQQKTPRQLS